MEIGKPDESLGRKATGPVKWQPVAWNEVHCLFDSAFLRNDLSTEDERKRKIFRGRNNCGIWWIKIKIESFTVKDWDADDTYYGDIADEINAGNTAQLEMTVLEKTIRSIKSGGGGTEPQGIEQW